MHIRVKSLKFKNFKAFKELTINPNEKFNIIIGENSAGKSTIFEGIHLWEKCYQALTRSKKDGFYKVSETTSRYLTFQEIDFLRIATDNDLFFDDSNKSAEVTITLKVDDVEFPLGFKISKPGMISNAFLRIQPLEQQSFSEFAVKVKEAGLKLDEVIFIYQTRPVANTLQNESYHNVAQLKKKVRGGLSHEVLRNKIVARRDNISQLQDDVAKILCKKVEFELPPKSWANSKEFVTLKVSIDEGKKQDLHLQGSGFLQILEILSTIEFLQAPLKLLLVDEPDSHIHSKLQASLIDHLRTIDHNQFFVISHNDQFVTNAGEGEVFFMSEGAKTDGKLEAIDGSGFDIIKNALGGVILSLERLNQAKHIAFVEGEDDALYLLKINQKIKQIHPVQGCLTNVTFFPLRGKDNIVQKIEYNKRTLSSLVKGKVWNVIFDKDFSTPAIDESLKRIIQGKSCKPHSHDGYCIESVIFTDLEILKRYICSLVDFLPHGEIEDYLVQVLQQIQNDICDISKPLSQSVEERFKGQKNNRPEFENLQFTDVVRSWTENGIFKAERVMSKPLIRDFVLQLENLLGVSLFLRESNNDEEVSSKLFINYINFINHIDDVAPSLVSLFIQFGVLEEPQPIVEEELVV
ncbi:AAA family ATPase [Vibrio parahaemolyticus]|nr:AAA family ATPase [Vibrio parahaemolyticus]